MKTLNTIQTLSKIGKVLSKIVFILSIIGAAVCCIGIVCYALLHNVIKIDGRELSTILAMRADISVASGYVIMAAGILLCAAEAVVARFAEIYFKNELAAGTPFTFEGAQEMLRLGIITIAVPLGTVIVCSIAVGIATQFASGFDKIDFSNATSVALGVMFIILSVIFKYGAEIREGK